MLYAGLDLSRKRLDFHLLDAEGATVDVGASPPDADGLRGLSVSGSSGTASRSGRPSRRNLTFGADPIKTSSATTSSTGREASISCVQ
jgi:hypothetical protein